MFAGCFCCWSDGMPERSPPTASQDGEGTRSPIIIGVVVVVSFCWCGVTSPESGMMSWPSRPGSFSSGERAQQPPH